MRVYFDEHDVLHLCPEDTTEAMALKYWMKEYAAHGSKMLDVEIEKHGELVLAE
jgi:hypothetical protein